MFTALRRHLTARRAARAFRPHLRPAGYTTEGHRTSTTHAQHHHAGWRAIATDRNGTAPHTVYDAQTTPHEFAAREFAADTAAVLDAVTAHVRAAGKNPPRYLIRSTAKALGTVTAEDPDGAMLTIERTDREGPHLGVDILPNGDVVVGHWPDGEEWTPVLTLSA